MSERIETRVGRLLRDRGLTLAVAESCTGGLICHRLTQVPGCSAYFLGGAVAYHNAVKIALLGVAATTLARDGAVSAETAAEMARGARRVFGADAAVAATGIAGPAGGSETKPVGLVYLAVAHGGGVTVRRRLFNGSRSAIKSRAAEAALGLLRECLRATRKAGVRHAKAGGRTPAGGRRKAPPGRRRAG
ncbi:MAG: CinA family protein [Candidatus Aureabacteria bacterium]|mgnify:CR=1 FL=1|nr:CinA family protein [Candidatus Auribacterota bacterium]NLW94027.1 CinA family protein [Chlamydiota bacterium]HOE28067.1 nicotinamide-nucleotide amidohydrolase family protein [bacterium]HQM53659.1 nicotinamide-nucleotide amidohydrolase family protein [bacterium]